MHAQLHTFVDAGRCVHAECSTMQAWQALPAALLPGRQTWQAGIAGLVLMQGHTQRTTRALDALLGDWVNDFARWGSKCLTEALGDHR